MTTTATTTMTTSKGRGVETPFTDMEAYKVCQGLTGSFPQSLVARPLARLSYDQTVWLHILAVEATTPKAPKTVIALEGGNAMANIVSILQTAGAALKYPKVRILTVSGKEIVINLSGEVAYVKDANEFVYNSYRGQDERVYYGKIEGGNWMPSRASSDDVETAIQAFSAAPLLAACHYGQVTGRCCFCGRKLTDAESTKNGYGPVCAKRYGL